MKQLRIALADPPRKEALYHANFPNLGLLYLAGSLRERLGDKCRLLFLDGYQSLDGHLAALERFQPHLYGLSFTYLTRFLAFKVVEQIRVRFSDLPILCGGAMPTAAPREVLESCPADLCIMGEGEATVCELAEYFLGMRASLEEVAGLAYRDQNGKLHETTKRAVATDLDHIPLPAWDLVDLARFPGWHMHRGQPQVQVQASRGCPHDCNFCSNPVWKYNKPWLRSRSPDAIAQEVQILYQMGVREVYLSADELNFSESWAIEVCRELAGLGHDDLYFNCNIRPDLMTSKLAAAFKKANLWCVHMGIESGNQRTLAGVGKKVLLEEIEESCRIMKEHNLKIFGFMMLFHVWEEKGSFCWEGPSEVDKTLLFCRYLLRNKLLDYISWQVTIPMPGSRLWDTAQKFNLFPKDTLSSIYSRNLDLPGVSQSDVRWALMKGLWLKNYYLVKNGKVNWRLLSATWPNLRVMMGLSPPKGAH